MDEYQARPGSSLNSRGISAPTGLVTAFIISKAILIGSIAYTINNHYKEKNIEPQNIPNIENTIQDNKYRTGFFETNKNKPTSNPNIFNKLNDKVYQILNKYVR